MLVVDEQIQIPLGELRLSFSRSSGPGGQNVNKVNSKVTLHWNVATTAQLPEDVRQRFLERYRGRITTDGDIVLSSQLTRDQGRNRTDCLEKLRNLILAVRRAPTPRRARKPSRAARERRLQDKHRHSERKRSRGLPPRGE
jgi:ribosome-associated protein